MKSILKKLLLLAFSGLLAIALLEVAIRKLLPHYDPRRQIEFKIDPAYNAAFGPRSSTIRQRTPKGDYDLKVTFNADGYRDTKDIRSSTADDLFALGDSFTMGWGVEEHERFSELLATGLGRRVFNIGIPGDLDQYAGLLRYAREHGATVSNVLLGICMNNDLKNYNRSDKLQPSKFGDASPWKARLRAQLQGRSAIYLALSYEIQRYRPLRKLCEKLGISRDINQLTLRNIYDEEVLASSLQKVKDLSQGFAPGQFRIMIIPTLGLWIGDSQDEERRIHEAFVRSLRDAGFSVLDMKPIMEADGNPRIYHFETDAHWNQAGHAFASAALVDWYRHE